MLRLRVLTIVPVLVLAHQATAVGQQVYDARYAVRLYGITFARSRFVSTVDGDSFAVRGTIATVGLARIIDRTNATAAAAGRFTSAGTIPETYALDYRSGRKKKRTNILFGDRKVARTTVTPAPGPRSPDNWVPVSEADLRFVTDPLSTVLIRADQPVDVCQRALKMYDGELVAEIDLSFESATKVDIPGYHGAGVTCRARFTPVAGYKKGNRSLAYLRDRSRMRITFAPLGRTDVYVPVRASVGTRIGTVTVQAESVTAAK